MPQAASSSGRNLGVACLAAGKADRAGLAAGVGSAPARNEEPGSGASLGRGKAMKASVPAAAAPAGVGIASASDEGPRGGAAGRNEHNIQDRSSSSSGKIARRGRPALKRPRSTSRRSLRQPQKTTTKLQKTERAPSPSHAAVAGETRQKEEHERAKGECMTGKRLLYPTRRRQPQLRMAPTQGPPSPTRYPGAQPQ